MWYIFIYTDLHGATWKPHIYAEFWRPSKTMAFFSLLGVGALEMTLNYTSIFTKLFSPEIL